MATTKTRRKTTKPAAKPADKPAAKPAAKPERPACAASDRHPDGRFRAGNPGGFGNPYARQVAILRRELMQTTRPEDIRGIGLKLKDLALEGNVSAAKLLFSYTLGKPMEAESPDRLNLAETRQFIEEAELLATPNPYVSTSPGLGIFLHTNRLNRRISGYKFARALAGGATATPQELEHHRQATAGMSDEQKVLAYGKYGRAKNYPEFLETEWGDEWEPWPQDAAAPNAAAQDAVAQNAKVAPAAAPSTNGSTAHPAAAKTSTPAQVPASASLGAAPSTNGHPAKAAPAQTPTGAPATNAANGKHPTPKVSRETPTNGKHEAPSTNRVIRAKSKYALVPKSLRPKGVIVPRF
jgi:hypothetical protein